MHERAICQTLIGEVSAVAGVELARDVTDIHFLLQRVAMQREHRREVANV